MENEQPPQLLRQESNATNNNMDPSMTDSPISRRELVGVAVGSTSNMPAISTRRSASRTITMTIEEQQQQHQQQQVEETTNEVLILTLQPRPTVTWDQTVLNNEGLGRKSSKRCCIFHKQREFGESSTESSEEEEDDDDDNSNDSNSSDGGNHSNSFTKNKKKIARKKKSTTPDFQRYHA